MMSAPMPGMDHRDPTLAEATAVVGHAIAEARRLGIAVSVAVCGREGRLVAFSKMDGAGCMTARRAIGKAVASAISGEPSEVMHPAGDVLFGSIVEGEGTAAFHARGGIALRRDGEQIGAVGVFGDASNDRQDLACATAGSDALRPPPVDQHRDATSFHDTPWLRPDASG